MKLKVIMKPKFPIKHLDYLIYVVKFKRNLYYDIKSFTYYPKLGIENNSFSICIHVVKAIFELDKEIKDKLI